MKKQELVALNEVKNFLVHKEERLFSTKKLTQLNKGSMIYTSYDTN